MKDQQHQQHSSAGGGDVASSLRWRSRISKEATSVPFDDSGYNNSNSNSGDNDDPDNVGVNGKGKARRWGGAGDGSNGGDNGAQAPSSSPSMALMLLRRFLGKKSMLFFPIKADSLRAFALNVAASALVAGSLWSLQVTHSFLMAVAATLNVTFAALAVWQNRRLRQHGAGVRRLHTETRHTVHNLSLQNERLYRRHAALDGKVDRIRHIESELRRKVVADGQRRTDVDEIAETLQSYRRVHAELQKQLKRHVEEQVLRAVLTSDGDHNWELSPVELEKLIRKLQVMPGVVKLKEQHLRAILVDSAAAVTTTAEEGESGGTSSRDAALVNVVRLLRQIANDSEVSGSSGTAAAGGATQQYHRTIGRRSANRRPYSSKSLHSNVFEFDTRSMLPQKPPPSSSSNQGESQRQSDSKGEAEGTASDRENLTNQDEQNQPNLQKQQYKENRHQQQQHLLMRTPPPHDMQFSSVMAL